MSDFEKLINGTQAEQLDVIERITASRLCLLLGGLDAVPDELSYIVTEVAVKRFNRIGSEGTESHTVEGEHMQWNTDDDFAEYQNDIQAWLDANDGYNVRRVRFL